MKIIVLFFLLMFLVAASCAAQQPCKLELKDAPSFFNLKLGMTEEEVREVFGKQLKFKLKKKAQERTFFQNFIKEAPPAILPGVRALYLRFVERRLYQIEIFYENRSEWQTLSDFTGSIAARQNFPEEWWSNARSRANIKCVDFAVVADKVLNPRLEITDRASQVKLAEIRQKQTSK